MYQVGDHIIVVYGWFKKTKGVVVNIEHGPVIIKEVKRDVCMNIYLYGLSEMHTEWVGKTYPFFDEHVERLEPLSLEFYLTHDDPYMRELGIKFLGARNELVES